jgi:NDP-sugar pyrophosphorylase family protein
VLADNFLVVNGDTLLDIDYMAMVSEFKDSGAEAMIAAYRNQAQRVASNLEVSADGLVLAYTKQQPTGDYVDAGVIALRKSVLDLIPGERKCSLEQEVFPALIARSQLRAWRTPVNFFDMGTTDGLAALEEHLR